MQEYKITILNHVETIDKLYDFYDRNEKKEEGEQRYLGAALGGIAGIMRFASGCVALTSNSKSSTVDNEAKHIKTYFNFNLENKTDGVVFVPEFGHNYSGDMRGYKYILRPGEATSRTVHDGPLAGSHTDVVLTLAFKMHDDADHVASIKLDIQWFESASRIKKVIYGRVYGDNGAENSITTLTVPSMDPARIMGIHLYDKTSGHEYLITYTHAYGFNTYQSGTISLFRV
ncbi:hypothetical protein I5M90_04265 [Serratia marcescens]|uniref:hypothetical protein n=1 Tax=Serratia marcescens TaxID=615 RepID=UPI000B644A7C|nr:hypothetical protein [Serratia marcescens]MBH2982590.1 hypothetical protein [Serratia marcescens]MBH3069329.1 hypothetical protein [Serratia marcescens]OUI66831.1 hypothetical protein AZZ99_001095 [Serratia marcescens]HEJ0329398.1 hypothetical protein [Serratia marcescens]